MNENLLAPDARDPWDPNYKAVEAFRRVIAGHLAEMFLDGKTDEVRTWARGIAQELKHAGLDIDDDVMTRLRQLTVGWRDDIPF